MKDDESEFIEKQKRDVRNFNRITNCILAITPLVFILCCLDIWHFGKYGNSLLNPFLDVLIALTAGDYFG